MTTTALINEYHALDAQHEAIKQRLASGDENASLELGRIMARKREIALAIFAPDEARKEAPDAMQ